MKKTEKHNFLCIALCMLIFFSCIFVASILVEIILHENYEIMLKSRKIKLALILLIVAVVSVLIIRNCVDFPQKGFVTNSGVVWTTEYHITYQSPVDLNDSIQKLLKDIDNSVSPFNKQSLVTSINQGKSDHVDAFVKTLYVKASEVNQASGGLYDPTVMPLVNAWGFGYKNGKLPTKEQLDSILEFVGMAHTKLDGDKLLKDDPRVQFDFSSIAKGMACDEIASMLKRNKVKNYMVEIGGEVVTGGVNDRGEQWHVSVDLPVADADAGPVHSNAVLLQLSNLAVATSGSYRKFKEVDGKKVSHIVNPKTGSSETSTLLSVSIVADDCMSADAWATACMAMGLEATQQMMESNNALGVMTISTDDDGNFIIWSNKRFADLIIQE